MSKRVKGVSEVLKVQELSRNPEVGTSRNHGSARIFQNLQKHRNNLQKPWNASVSLETLEGYLVSILTLLLKHSHSPMA